MVTVPAPSAAVPASPGHFLVPCILLLVQARPTKRGELLELLRAFGFHGAGDAELVAAVDTLEGDGLLLSDDDTAVGEPGGYRITAAGERWLAELKVALRNGIRLVARFLERYGESRGVYR